MREMRERRTYIDATNLETYLIETFPNGQIIRLECWSILLTLYKYLNNDKNRCKYDAKRAHCYNRRFDDGYDNL